MASVESELYGDKLIESIGLLEKHCSSFTSSRFRLRGLFRCSFWGITVLSKSGDNMFRRSPFGTVGCEATWFLKCHLVNSIVSHDVRMRSQKPCNECEFQNIAPPPSTTPWRINSGVWLQYSDDCANQVCIFQFVTGAWEIRWVMFAEFDGKHFPYGCVGFLCS